MNTNDFMEVLMNKKMLLKKAVFIVLGITLLFGTFSSCSLFAGKKVDSNLTVKKL